MTDKEVLDSMVRSITAIRRFVIGVALAGVLAGVPAASAATQAEVSGQSKLLRQMNAARIAHGVPPLRISKVLNGPAQRHSRYLARIGDLDHTGADGRPFWARLYGAGFSRRKTVGENLGMIGGCSPFAAKTMVDMWLASPGHRRNLLSRQFKVVGLAVVQADDCSYTIYTTDFGG